MHCSLTEIDPNDLEFLIKTVWRFNVPVRIIDFGCGYGYLGTKLMPLLPHGSTYTGIDAGEKLVERAMGLVQTAPFQTEFYLGDIHEIKLERKYDVAVCHALLLHMANPMEILRRMIDCLVDGGRIICFEPHWISCMANYYLDGYSPSELIQLGFLQELYERDEQRTGKDGNIGIKVPVYLSQLGVSQVECRVSDKVNFLDQNLEITRRDALYSPIKEDGFGAVPGEEVQVVTNLVNRGASYEELPKMVQLLWFGI